MPRLNPKQWASMVCQAMSDLTKKRDPQYKQLIDAYQDCGFKRVHRGTIWTTIHLGEPQNPNLPLKKIDTESGVTVGSVAQAAVMDKMAKTKSKEVGLDFYRFQKREAHRNEIMMLSTKFEQDEKRKQQL